MLDLLRRNKDRLLAFLPPLLQQREEKDEHFRDEKVFLLDEIRKLSS